jgi:hypothetical protein
MSSLEVDIEALKTLGQRLHSLHLEFDALAADIGAYDQAIGSRRVAHRLSELAGNWKHHRQRLGADLEELACMAIAAAAQYRQTETNISSAAGGS